MRILDLRKKSASEVQKFSHQYPSEHYRQIGTQYGEVTDADIKEFQKKAEGEGAVAMFILNYGLVAYIPHPQVAPQTTPYSLEELKAKLAQYKRLTDFTARLNFSPPPKRPMRCIQCGEIYDYFQPTWEEVEFELGKGRDPLRELSGYCPKCRGPEEDNEVAPMTSSTGREGLCFMLAYRHIVYQDEGTLVHGKVWSEKLGQMIDHAWVITETGYIYEPVSDQYFIKDSLYERYKMQEINTYTPDEARKMVLVAKNYGPWSDEDRQKAGVTQTRLVPMSRKRERLTKAEWWWDELRYRKSPEWAKKGVKVRNVPYEQLSPEEKKIVYHFFSTGELPTAMTVEEAEAKYSLEELQEKARAAGLNPFGAGKRDLCRALIKLGALNGEG